MPDLLIELFSEEVPARMQAKAAEDLKRLMTDAMVDAGLTYASAAAFATPRRLALTVEGLLAESPTVREERKGPKTDAPDKALDGFLRSTGLTKDQLEVRDDKKGQVYFATITREGRSADAIVAEALTATIRTFPWPKSMRWGAGSLRWVRPLHTILAILSDDAGARVVEAEIEGIATGDTTEGHRFMAPGRFAVTSFEDYEARLKRQHVILRADERAEMIRNDAAQLAFAQGLEVVADEKLLREVAGLVEWPVVLMGDIGAAFLDLPPEVLQTSMAEHQKFFSVRNPNSGRIEKFVTVANRETADTGATILAGNAKVLRARLSDAKFFWENDLRVARAGMGDWLKSLDNVTFHNKLGSVGARIARIAELAAEIAPAVGADPALAREAAEVTKADLASEMVYEFPELQGVMGRYYAEAAGRPAPVAAAAEAHYAPLGPSDTVPTEPVSVAVALAEKIDALAGFWAIDEKPTGSKDPFALRRAGLGVIRIVLENDVRLPLLPIFERQILRNEIAVAGDDTPGTRSALLEILKEIGAHGIFRAAFDAVWARQGEGEADQDPRATLLRVKEDVPGNAADLQSFLADRLKVHLKGENVRHDVIDACFGLGGQDDLTPLVHRARALNGFLDTEDGENLLQGYKRANNILTAEEKKDGIEYSLDPDPKFAENADETALFQALDTANTVIASAVVAEDFDGAMKALAALRTPIDAFFESTLINSENQVVRRNRLCLLNRIRTTMNKIADFGRIDG